MERLRNLLSVFSGGIAIALFAVAWVPLRWLERGPAGTLTTGESWRQPSLVGSHDPWMV
jgi:hypothetical protein